MEIYRSKHVVYMHICMLTLLGNAYPVAFCFITRITMFRNDSCTFLCQFLANILVWKLINSVTLPLLNYFILWNKLNIFTFKSDVFTDDQLINGTMKLFFYWRIFYNVIGHSVGILLQYNFWNSTISIENLIISFFRSNRWYFDLFRSIKWRRKLAKYYLCDWFEYMTE